MKNPSIKLQSKRRNFKDLFNSFLVSDAIYDGLFDIPILESTDFIPNQLLPFSRINSTKDFNYWIHFYEDDYKFDAIWKNPKIYLDKLKKFNGVILPDFSIYRDMPFPMQIWNIYRSRAIGFWLQKNGIKIIINVRFGDERTYSLCTSGIKKGCSISVGSHGTLKNRIDKQYFIKGLDEIIRTLEPKTIINYGSNNDLFDKYSSLGIKVLHFKPNTYFFASKEGGK